MTEILPSQLAALVFYSALPSILGIAVDRLLMAKMKTRRCERYKIQHPIIRYSDHLLGFNFSVASLVLLPAILSFYENGSYSLKLPAQIVISIDHLLVPVFVLTAVSILGIYLTYNLSCNLDFRPGRERKSSTNIKEKFLIMTGNALGGASLSTVILFLLLARH